MATEVTDPALLAQLNGVPQGPREVTDPALLAQLNGQPDRMDTLGRQLGLAGRAVINGVTGIPQMAADAGIAARNLVTGHVDPTNWKTLLFGSQKAAQAGATPSFSSQFNESLTQAGLPEPKTTPEKIAGFVESTLAGSQVPIPSIRNQAPAEFIRPVDMERQVRSQTLRDGQDLGLVVPPSTSNRTATNMTLETIAGKVSTQQSASARNTDVINQVAKREVGINPDAPLNPESLRAVRQEAAQFGYEPIRQAGVVVAPESFHRRLTEALSRYQGAERSFPGMGRTDLEGVVNQVDRPFFDSGDAIDLTRILRDRADAAFRAGETGTGQGLRQISTAVEDALEEGLQTRGLNDLVNRFRGARQLIARAHTVEDAMNPGTGDIIASRLAAALRRGDPIGGDLRTVARFASAYPKAVGPATHSLGVNHLDIYAPISTAIWGHTLGEKALGLAVPVTRWGARNYLFSPMGQAGALPQLPVDPTGRLPMAIAGAYGGTQ